MGVDKFSISALRVRFDGLISRGFVRSVGVLAGGTAFAQALTILALPVLTRLYTPEDFSVLAVYASILAIVSIVAGLRLEIAIPMPRQDGDAANLLAVTLLSSATTAALVGVVVWLFPGWILRLTEQPALIPYLWILPLGIWFASSYSAMQYWATRKKRFSNIAKTRLTQAIGGSGSQIGLGWAGITPFGLLFGHMISSGAGLFGLGRNLLKYDRAVLRTISVPRMRRVFGEYDRFPKYSTFDALANTAGIQLPIIIIAAVAAGPEAGLLMLAMRAMQAPMGLIGGAVAQVYLSQAPQKARAGDLASFTADVLNGLVRSGVGPLLFAGLVAAPAFAIVFGDEWRRAGELVAWMTPWFVFQFLSSPVSMVMHVRKWQRAMLSVTVSGLVMRIGAMGIAARYDQQRLSEYYAVSSAIFYCGCYWVFTFAAGIYPWAMARIFRKTALVLAVWILLGVGCRMLLQYLGL